MDYQPYINRLKREKEKERRLNAARREQAVQTAHKLSSVLKKDFGVERVLLFGSCLHPEYFHESSDIDLGVQGLATENLGRAWFDLNTFEGGFKVDLIDLRACDDCLRKRIFREGREL